MFNRSEKITQDIIVYLDSKFVSISFSSSARSKTNTAKNNKVSSTTTTINENQPLTPRCLKEFSFEIE